MNMNVYVRCGFVCTLTFLAGCRLEETSHDATAPQPISEISNPSESASTEIAPSRTSASIPITTAGANAVRNSLGQVLYFTNIRNVPVSRITILDQSKKSVTLKLNHPSGKSSQVLLSLDPGNGGFLSVEPLGPQPYLCIDPNQNICANISGDVNCSSPIFFSGSLSGSVNNLAQPADMKFCGALYAVEDQATWLRPSPAAEARPPAPCRSQEVFFDGKCSELLPPNPVGTTAAPAFGFNYAPGTGEYPLFLSDDFIRSQDRVAKDMGLMKSMGVNTVRLMIRADQYGMPPGEYNRPTRQWDAHALTLAQQNLPNLVRQFGVMRIRVIVTFTPNLFYWRTFQADSNGAWPALLSAECRKPGLKWWQCRYANRWNDFVSDYVAWQKQIISSVEGNPQAAANILYYDLINELQYADDTGTDMKGLVRSVIQNASLPNDKIGFSLVQPVETLDLPHLAADLRELGKKTSFIEVHCYPDSSCSWPSAAGTVEEWLNRAYSNFRSAFRDFQPQPHFLIGEFGSDFDGNTGAKQARGEKRVLEWMRTHGDIAGALHWSLYDHPNGGVTQKGVAPTPGTAQGTRESYMVLGTMRGALVDGDFESGAEDWYVGGPSAQMSVLPSASATGDFYGRMKVKAPGSHWFCTRNFVLPDGWYVTTGGFLRTGLASVKISTRYFDSNWAFLGEDPITWTQPGSWQWRQIQDQSLSKRAGFWRLPYAAQVCFSIVAPPGTNDMNPQYLDLDSITIFDY